MADLERPRSGLSVASSVATISSVNLGSKPTRSVKRVHTFGKREYAIKRDPNSAVVIRGWLYKQDSAGLRLWKRRWFVLSDFCLFYYRDSREETVLGSILLPSYDILPAGPREAKNRKFTFKAEHSGMRTYYFGADTQEDMNSWVRAMNQSALVVAENNNKMGHLNNISSTVHDGYYASYEDFTRPTLSQNGEHTKSAESLEIAHLSDTRSQQNSSSDSLLGPDHGGDAESKGGPFSSEPRDPPSSSSEDVEQLTPASQHGGAPPSTPVCGVKKVDFSYDLLSGGRERLAQRKESISQVEEWVCLQKEKLMVRDYQEPFSQRTPSTQVSKSFENNHERYPPVTSMSYALTVSPSSPSTNRQLLPVPEPETFDQSVVEGRWERKEDSPATTWPESPRHVHSSKLKRPVASPPTERANIAGPALIRASRSYSLPPTPSDLSRPRTLPIGMSLDEEMNTALSGGRGIYYSVTPQAQKSRSPGTHSPRAVHDGPRSYHQEKGTLSKPHASSCEELDLIGSSSPNRKTVMRPHTPMGRVDMHPSEDSVVSHTPLSRNAEEKHSDSYITSTSTRNRGPLRRSSSRPQTPADRYDVLPSDDTYSTLSMVRPPGQAIRYPRRSQHPGLEDERPGDGYTVILAPRLHGPGGGRMQYTDRTFMMSPAGVTRNSTPRLHAKMGTNPPPASPGYSQLPPLPPFSSRSASHVMPGKRISLALPPHSSGMFRERMPRPIRMAENDTDVLLTRLCGQDKLLQSLEEEFVRLRTDKEKLETVLEVTRQNLAEFQGQEHMMEKIWYQQRMLQDDLVHVRARLCDVTLEKEQAWEDYRVLENDLHALRETLEHVRQVGHPQDQAIAQRDLWMINDIISGLRANKNSVYITPEPTRHPALVVANSPVDNHQPSYQQNFTHIPSPAQDPEVIPPRPPLPRDHATTPAAETEGQTNGNNNNQVQGQQELSSKHPLPERSNPAGQRLLDHSSGSAFTSSVSVRGVGAGISSPTRGPASPGLPRGTSITTDPEPKPSPPRSTEGGTSRKQRMSAEEQLQRMRRHQEAQIQERVKPGATLNRQGSHKSATTNGGGQVTPQATESRLDSPSAESPGHQKPALVKVTSSYYPITLATSQKTKAAWFLEPGTPNGSTMAPGDKGDEVTDPQSVVVVNLTSRSSQEVLPMAKVSPPVRTSSKLITATRRSFRTGSNSTDVQDRGPENIFEFPNHVQGSFSTGTEPCQPLSPEKMEYSRSGTREPMKNMVSASPATSPRGLGRHPDEEFTNAPAVQQERIINLSYTLATEASQRSKLMTAKTLADEYSDDSAPEDAEDWDFLLQEVYSCTQPESSGRNPHTPCKSTASRHTEAEQPSDRITSQVTESTGRHLEDKMPQYLHTETVSDEANSAESPGGRLSPWDYKVGCYEKWTLQERLEATEPDRGSFLKREQVSSRVSGCNGRVTNSGYQMERADFAHADLDKVVGYLKEPEDAIHVTVLQSSF